MGADSRAELAAHPLPARSGVLLVNLGTPDAPTAPAIRRYLRQFLSDRRVVEFPRLLWALLLHAFILPFRPSKLVHAYAKVWTAQGSPLMAISREQQAALAHQLGDAAVVELAMTYGEPSIERAVTALEGQGVRRLLVLPLYPQYSGTTTAAVFDALFDALKRRRWIPELRTIASYHDDDAHLDALAARVRAYWTQHGRGERLLMSFHSIPRQYLEAGDPYFCQCHKTARLLAERLGLAANEWAVSFQSRLGRQPWLQPYTDCVVPQLARQGIRILDVICPGFAADCLETLEEVALRYADDFLAAGGAALRYIPALNADSAQIDALAALCRRHLQGWDAPREDLAARARRIEEIRPSLSTETLRSP